MSRTEKLWYGWSLVVVLFVGIVVVSFVQRGPKPPAEPNPADVEQLRSAHDQQQAVLLTKISDAIVKQDSSAQVLLLQAAPGTPPVVVANVVDEDSGEGATHWPAPWPAVQQAMTQPVLTPTLLAGEYAGAKYRHRLIPLDAAGTRVLLVNSAAPPKSWWSVRNLLLAATCLLALGMAVLQLSDD
jgi:hypothetical protein